MVAVPVDVIVAAFDDPQGARSALSDLKIAKWARIIDTQNAAVIREDEQGKVHIDETADLSGGQGLRRGVAVGAVIDHMWDADLGQALREAGAEVVTAEVTAELTAQLQGQRSTGSERLSFPA